MDALPTLTFANEASYDALVGNLQASREILDDDGLAASPEAEDTDDAIDQLSTIPESYPHTFTLSSSNAVRVIRAAIDAVANEPGVTDASIKLVDTV